MSVIAEELVKSIRALPKEDRVPVIRSILVSAKGDVEPRVTRAEERLKAGGMDATDALVEALNTVLHEPGGDRIVKALAYAGAATTTATKGGDVKDIEQKFAMVLSRAEKVDLEDEEGLAFWGTIIAAAAAVIGAATSGIAAAVRKARNRRRTLKLRLTPLSTEEITDIVVITANTHATFESAIPEILGLIAGMRADRVKFLLDPTTDDTRPGGRKAGSVVNEYRDVRDAFNARRREVNALIAAEKRRKNLIYGGAATGGVAILGVMIVLARRK